MAFTIYPHLAQKFGMNSDVIYSPSVRSWHVKGWEFTHRHTKKSTRFAKCALLRIQGQTVRKCLLLCQSYRNGHCVMQRICHTKDMSYKGCHTKDMSYKGYVIQRICHTKDIHVVEDTVNKS